MAATDVNKAVDGAMETSGGGGTFTPTHIYFSFSILSAIPNQTILLPHLTRSRLKVN